MAKFEITQGKDDKFYFRLKASNGEVIATSQGYKQKRSALNGIESVRKNAADAMIDDMTTKEPA